MAVEERVPSEAVTDQVTVAFAGVAAGMVAVYAEAAFGLPPVIVIGVCATALNE